MKILANCVDVNFQSSLGVPHYTYNLLRELSLKPDVEVTCLTYDGHQDPIMMHVFSDVVTPDEFDNTAHYDIEYQPHHLQPATTSLPQLATVFDLHVYDVEWKYGARGLDVQQSFNTNVSTADAIVVPFVRPYKRLPDYVDVDPDRLFYVDCPLLIGDTEVDSLLVARYRRMLMQDHGVKILYYPATLQEHKNHKRLFSAVKLLVNRGHDIHLVCSGPEFRPDITTDIMQHAEDLGIRHRISMIGRISSDGVRVLYEIADLIVSPSLAEGGCAIVHEAIYFGRPAACSKIESAVMQLERMNAYVPMFDPTNVSDIAHVIEHTLDDPQAVVANNNTSRATIANWTWSKLGDRYYEIAQWLLGLAPKPPDAWPAL